MWNTPATTEPRRTARPTAGGAGPGVTAGGGRSARVASTPGRHSDHRSRGHRHVCTSLWAFLDKTFGLGYSTRVAKAWVNGGSPTKGFPRGGGQEPSHLVNAVLIIALAVYAAGGTWGFGELWARLRLVRRNSWLR